MTLEPDDRGLNETRGYACEIIAWRFLTHKSDLELIDYLLHELPPPASRETYEEDDESETSTVDEYGGLLGNPTSPGVGRSTFNSNHRRSSSNKSNSSRDEGLDEDPTRAFVGLNALEIAAVADAKKFLSQRVVQKIVLGIWNGDIVFWNTLSVRTQRKPQRYNKR